MYAWLVPQAARSLEALNCDCYDLSYQLCFVTSCVQLFVTSWTAAHQASLSLTISWSLLKLMSIELVMPPHHLILCCLLLLLPSVFPCIRVFTSESALRIKWPKLLDFQLYHQSFQ